MKKMLQILIVLVLALTLIASLIKAADNGSLVSVNHWKDIDGQPSSIGRKN